MRSARVFLGAVAALAFAACAVRESDADPAEALDVDAGVATRAFTEVVSIDQIAVYQGVKVTLVAGGETLAPNAPIVPKRPMLVRVGTKTAPRAKVNKLAAELRVRTPGRPDAVLVSGPRAPSAFDEGDPSTSFGWELDSDQVLPGTSMSVTIRDPSGADPGELRYPVDGELPLRVGELAPRFRVTFVPVRYDADGSGRLPPMDKAKLDAYRAALYRLYPVSKVDVTVREPLAWPLEVRGDGAGWSELLDAMMKTRDADGVADDVYYVGVFVPNATQREYCQAGCILGIAPAQTLGDSVSLRTAMVVGYDNPRQFGTLAQELAHAMGRMHAPCGGPTGIDKKYPYEEGGIGGWGWDVVDRELVSPDDRYDFMSYCSPVWVSDYTFAALYERMGEVEKTKRPDVGEPERPLMKTYHVGADGSLRAGPTIRGGSILGDELVLEGAGHEVLARVRGAYRPISNLGGGIFVTPTAIPEATLRRARVRSSEGPFGVRIDSP